MSRREGDTYQAHHRQYGQISCEGHLRNFQVFPCRKAHDDAPV